MMKNLPFISTLILTLLLAMTFSQGISQGISQDGIMDFGMYYSNPLGEFKSDGYKEGIGFNFGLYSKALQAENGLAAFRFGGRFNADFSGRSKGDMISQIPDTDLFGEMHLENSAIGIFAVSRIESTPYFPVQLYVEGMLGTRSLLTSESFNDHEDFQDDECISSTVLRDWSLAYGASAGTLIRLGERTRLDIRATYLTSTPARFVDLSTAQQVEDNLYQYETRTAPGTQFQIQAGLSFDVDFRCAPTRSSLACGGGGCDMTGVVARP